ncbi:hypothetical protein EPUS_07861 [Endocarpon pusillum Z07020]|uniref:Mediator of RNA polymerase II transcription subunit 31 n=1 Tax=Endocarpon pusillum (strain Z07020 / HMAS-L-300199) TaxID=1263415 RepID=U1HNG3_ENDPU|nr:uncharacterized protein EPUS_07861 [Endocarpon pusillum Z07020]ERF70564.1 hypothetical protein EPUS_07861 [Endocarpon pusillum Z07020]
MSTTTVPLSSPSNTTATAPKPPSPRFTLELEFVLSLSNPYYLSHLALTYPHLLNPPKDSKPSAKPSNSTSRPEPEPEPESDATKFASYLSYLYSYWRKPEYARFLTHPGATLRNLELLQQEQFRRDMIRPDVIEKLLVVGSGGGGTSSTAVETEQDGVGVKMGQPGQGDLLPKEESEVKEEKG